MFWRARIMRPDVLSIMYSGVKRILHPFCNRVNVISIVSKEEINIIKFLLLSCICSEDEYVDDLYFRSVLYIKKFNIL